MTARSPVTLLLAAVLVLGGCAGEEPAKQAAAPSGAPTVTFVGDSWTVGLGATDLRSYAVLTAERLGWRYTLLGVNGSGYVRSGAGGPFAHRIDEATQGRPDVLVVQGSLNDSLAELRDVEVAAHRTLTELSGAVPPGTRVLVVGAPSSPGVEEGVITAINDVLAEAADAAGFPFVDPAERQWVDPDDPELWADPLHPDDDGHLRMARQLAPLLRDLVEG